jgi:hypothetical protein
MHSYLGKTFGRFMAYNKTVSTADIIIKIHVINTPEFLNIDDRGMF